MKKNRALLEKTEHALHQHSMITILIGRFVGPTRPLVPMVAGMLDLPVAKFMLPNIIGCLLWPPLYFLPGILAGAAIDIPADENSASFKWFTFHILEKCNGTADVFKMEKLVYFKTFSCSNMVDYYSVLNGLNI